MAYVNVAEWSPDQVAEWLKGLDDVIQPYIHYFVENQVNGKRLLHLSYADFPSLNVTCIGHQAIILQGVELLRNIHYHLDRENLQYLALRLSSKARSVYNEFRQCNNVVPNGISADEDNSEKDAKEEARGGISNSQIASQGRERVSTRILSGVVDVLSSVKSIVTWLHRSPFSGVEEYDNLKSSLVDLSVGLATIAQREFAFSENPASAIRDRCFTLAELADKIVQDFRDPLILQPASLDVVTIKKRADDNWGLNLMSSYHGIHQITVIRALSQAHTCGKLMGDDQIVQVNYQTIVGWTSPKVTQLMDENPCEAILTVKKCPRHDASNLAKIYFKPIRLPSKKRIYSPWTNKVLSPTKYDLQSIPNLEFIKTFDGRSAAKRDVSTEPHPKSISPPPDDSLSGGGAVNSSASDSGAQSPSDSDEESEFEDDAFLSDSDIGGSASLNVRLFQPKPRPPVQRRATIPGATAHSSLSFEQMLRGFCQNRYFPAFNAEPALIRPKQPSPDPRPHTCIGTEKKLESASLEHKDLPFIDDTDEKDLKELDSSSIMNTESFSSSPVFNSTREISQEGRTPPKYMFACPSVSVVEVQEDGNFKEDIRILSPPSSPVDFNRARRVSDDRPRLDKSYSSPTYDDSEEPPDFFNKTNTLEVTPSNTGKSQSHQQTPSKKEAEGVPSEEREFSSTEPPRKKVQMMPPPLTNSSDSAAPQYDQYYKNITLKTQEAASTSLGSLASLALSTIPISAVPASASAFDQVYGMANDSNTLSQRGVIIPHTNTITVNVLSCDDTLSDTSSYVAMNGIEDLGGSPPLNLSQRGDPNFSTTNQAPSNDISPKVISDAQHGNEISPSPLSSREERMAAKSPLAWRKGLVLSGAGNRRVSCRELGQCDHHGWLYRRKESKGFLMSHRWEKRWFVLKKSDLYGYRDRDSTKADSYIYLPGFYVCPASDIKSKRFAFKIYHTSGATFYFACDTAEERSRWMSQMGLSAISKSSGYTQKGASDKDSTPTEEAYYSETDDELDDKSPVTHRAHIPSRRKESHAGLFKSSPHLDSRNVHASPSGKNAGIRFLQASKPSLGQPVPTSNFRSYVRVRDSNPPRSTSVNNLLNSESISPEKNVSKGTKETPKAGKVVRRKGSLRERLKQIPASLTLDRKRGHQRLNSEVGETACATPTTTIASMTSKSIYNTSSKSETSLIDKFNAPEEAKTPSKISSSSSYLPNYMKPTLASSQNLLRVNYESDSLNRRTANSNSLANVASSSSLYGNSRRGSLSGMSSSNASTGSLSPRRGSLDCLSHSSPPPTPLKGAIVPQKEYEGSPEKNWISSLRSDGSRSRALGQSSSKYPEKKKDISNDILKRTSDYHALDFKGKGEAMQPAFEMNLSGPRNVVQKLSSDKLPVKFGASEKNAKPSPPKPQVPPRTKFLSPSERILSSDDRKQSSPPTYSPTPATSSPNKVDLTKTPSRISRSKAPPNLMISPTSEDSDSPKTPLKPAMGIAMIGKQRRTPVGVLSPREILPHYPGTEYPPTFEPESYSINLSSEQPVLSQSKQDSPQSIPRSSPHLSHSISSSPQSFSPQSQNQQKMRSSPLQVPYSSYQPQTKESLSTHERRSPVSSKYPPLPKRSPRSSPTHSTRLSPQSVYLGRIAGNPSGSLSPVKEHNPLDEAAIRSKNAGYVNISHVSSTLDDLNSNSYHHTIYVTSPCSQGKPMNFNATTHSTSSLNSSSNERVREAPSPFISNPLSYTTTDPMASPEAQTDFQLNAYLPMDNVNLHHYMNVRAENQHLEIKEKKGSKDIHS